MGLHKPDFTEDTPERLTPPFREGKCSRTCPVFCDSSDTLVNREQKPCLKAQF